MSQQKISNMGGEWLCTTPGTVVSSSGIVLASLLESIDSSLVQGDPSSCLIKTVSVDSRNSDSHALFIALCGAERDGHDFVEDILESGCAAVLVEKGRIAPDKYSNSKTCVIEVDNSRKVYAILAEALFSHPSQAMTMLAVTGTNGKTSISYLLESVLSHAGKQVGVIGTINYRYYNTSGEQTILPSLFTTPEPLLLQASLRKMADAGVDCVIMEVSSHGLEQSRIGQLMFDVVAFTNLSRDHLDYHYDMESYFLAKSLLFTEHLQAKGQAVIGFFKADSSWSERLLDLCSRRSLVSMSCGRVGADMYPLSVTGSLKNTEIHLQTNEGEYSFTSPLVGDFNVENLQICFAMALAAGVAPATICDSLQDATGAPGRMQRLSVCAGEEQFRPTVFVDYAHTPDALEQVLKTVNTLAHKRLYCVFGCGGDRDSGKRAVMGKICGTYADIAIVTDDNPRSEDSAYIRQMVADGVQETDLPRRDKAWLQKGANGGRGFVLIPERRTAIAATIRAAGKNDIVLIAGKGHEDYQITEKGKQFFDDTLEAQNALYRWNSHSLSLATNGKCVDVEHGTGTLGDISTDSRKIAKNDIFVALKGERFDAHDYVDAVVAAGAGCLVLEREPIRPTHAVSVPYILVTDSQKALGDLAAYRRVGMKSISNPQVIGITGSSGKTTVKEMCFAIFRQRWPDRKDTAHSRVLKTEGNFNNLIGLPLSLLPLAPKHRSVILEMGMNQPGEIKRLTEIADPDVACILNVHGAHLQGLGTIEGVAEAKGELFRTCAKETVLVVNNDDPRVVALAETCEQVKIRFGIKQEGEYVLDVCVFEEAVSKNEEIQFTLQIGEQRAPVTLHLPGAHNVSNALAAAAIAHAAGISLGDIAKGLSSFRPADRRMQIVDGPSGSRIINDTYNANPESMKAGIKTLSGLGNAPRIAILGDMLELGSKSEELHREIGSHLAEAGIEYIGVLGDYARFVQEGVRENRSALSDIQVFTTREKCYNWLQELFQKGLVKTGSYILVKGSRGMQLDKFVELLVNDSIEPEGGVKK